MKDRLICIFLMLSLAACTLCGCSVIQVSKDVSVSYTIVTAEVTVESTQVSLEEDEPEESSTEALIDEDGVYTSCEDVSLYIYTYGHLPSNFITKVEARELGWEGGSLEPYAPGMCIGGDYFGNYEHLLPEAEGREYHECDVDTLDASSRGAHRIIYSNDGLIYCTEDHYETFTLLYGEEG
jgi:guanyl-specific ribonuclease Sa